MFRLGMIFIVTGVIATMWAPLVIGLP